MSEVKVVIEKGQDGLYSAYCPDFDFNGYSFGGFGESASEAKADFLASVEDVKNLYREKRKCNADELDTITFDWHYDVPSMFGCFPYLNITKFAEFVGVNASKMRQYASGIAYPSEKTTQKIATAMQNIAADLSNIHFS